MIKTKFPPELFLSNKVMLKEKQKAEASSLVGFSQNSGNNNNAYNVRLSDGNTNNNNKNNNNYVVACRSF